MTAKGQTALITGGTDGIGKEVALRLTRLGAEVIIIGRNREKGVQALRELQKMVSGSRVHFHEFDLSLMRDVEKLAALIRERYHHLDILVHCAGVMLSKRVLTDEGLETVFAVQYLARFLLTRQLIDVLKASPNPRVVNVSAGGTMNMSLDFDNLNGEKSYSGVNALKHESVANDMITLELNRCYPQVKFYDYGPGYVRTTLMRDMGVGLRFFAATFGRFISISPAQAADQILSLLTSDLPGGLYGRKMIESRMRHHEPSAFRADPANRKRLWEITEKMIADALAPQK